MITVRHSASQFNMIITGLPRSDLKTATMLEKCGHAQDKILLTAYIDMIEERKKHDNSKCDS